LTLSRGRVIYAVGPESPIQIADFIEVKIDVIGAKQFLDLVFVLKTNGSQEIVP
jgi:hypothetical protein